MELHPTEDYVFLAAQLVYKWYFLISECTVALQPREGDDCPQARDK